MHEQLANDPYRVARSISSHAVRPTPKRQARFALREMVALGLTVALGDLAFRTYGGVTQAIFFLTMPFILWLGARIRVKSWLFAALFGGSLLFAGRALFAPSPALSVTGVLALYALSYASRVRRILPLEFVRSITTVPLALGIRARALGEGLRLYLPLRHMSERASALSLTGLVLAIFAGIFAAANPTFFYVLREGAELVVRWFPSPLRMIAWGAMAGGALVLLRPVCRRVPRVRDIAEPRPSGPEVKTLALALPLGLNALFLIEILTDAPNVLAFRVPLGTSTQEYAHAGAAWLALALLLLNLSLGLLHRGTLGGAHGRASRAFSYALLVQGGVLALLTYGRMLLHVRVSGLSMLHIVGFLGVLLIAYGLVCVCWMVQKGRTFGYLVRRQLEALVATFAVFLLTPTDLVVARYNVNRIQHGDMVPVVQLAGLTQSSEAVPELVPLLSHPDARVREGMLALLQIKSEALGGEPESVLSWSVADHRARASLSTVRVADESRWLDACSERSADGIERCPLRAFVTLRRDLADAASLQLLPLPAILDADGTPLPHHFHAD